MSVELKIKAKHLGAEARIIRFQEEKIKKAFKNQHNIDKKDKLLESYMSLRNHRQFEVRTEARATHLARAFIKGASYESVENRRLMNDYYFALRILPRVHMMAMKYGNRKTTIEDIKKWVGLE